ncbi:threonine--tRNA ligase [Paenibacillus whitsoniae]|uniref:Threonine--tRNA ligase n=1 Tax=Paenibacillus whitsoniae TaxID=2496558 RepID=A0A3S0A1X0_9BACL|nr:threonine--tRNA ligase [Paenibacillus whitsoniae]
MAFGNQSKLEVMRHTTAHVLAQAVKRLYGAGAVKLGIGPVIADGFYYDMALEKPLSPEDLAAIEQVMAAIVRENLPILRKVVSREEALAWFEELGETFKLEIIRDLPEDAELTVYEQGEFADLCRGPHVSSTGEVGAFKLLHTSGAYWRGDAANVMLQRIYGTAFGSVEELEAHLALIEEAKKRDHRKLGKDLDLFMFSEEAPGMPFFLPQGMIIRNELEGFARELQRKRGYEEVRTPLMMNNRVWEQSGHWDHYKDNMYFTQVDDVKFALKPMNCPGHMLIFKNSLHSYRELPIRISEFGQVHRHEMSGALNGMMRVRTFCQDDAHLFVLPEQIGEEIGQVIELIHHVYDVLGFAYTVELSTRPDEKLGSDELWDQAEQALQNVLDQRGIPYQINEGDGAFYGPKIDFHILDSLKRSWQCGTIQLDFQMPDKFDLAYVGEDGRKHRPVVIHRALYGSMERFIGMLTEHFAGAFPLWLAPTQVMILPVSEHQAAYAYQVKQLLTHAGVRAEVDARQEKLGYRLREAQLRKAPYVFVVGDREMQAGEASVRARGAAQGTVCNVEEIATQLAADIRDRKR